MEADHDGIGKTEKTSGANLFLIHFEIQDV
jgi:hypothetical protein